MPVNSTMRFGGMASGLDTEAMIRNMMKVEQMKVDRVVQQRISMEWTQNLRVDINSQLTSFRNSIMSVLSDKNLSSASAFKGNKVSGIPTGSWVDISAGSGAFQGHYSIEVNRLATGAKVSSQNLPTLDLSGHLEQIGAQFDEQDEVRLSINDVDFTFNRETTVRQMIDQINRSEAGVQVRYSELTQQLSMTSIETGEAARLDIVSESGLLFDETWSAQPGTDAEAVINGIVVNRSENVFTIDQVHYRLIAETNQPLQFTVEQNIDETVDRIINFVDEYNKLLGSLQDTVNQRVYRDFHPLTDEQKAELSDREIEMWEEKAMSGLLRNDRALGRLISQMRTGIFDSVAGTGLNLTSIGIMTGSYQEQGQLHLDEEQLRRALADDPDNVMKLFTQTADDQNSSDPYGESGLLQRLRNAFNGYTDTTFKPARYAEEMVRINNQINRMNQMLMQKEEAYWRQFSAMEQALNSMYAQTESMMASLGM